MDSLGRPVLRRRRKAGGSDGEQGDVDLKHLDLDKGIMRHLLALGALLLVNACIYRQYWTGSMLFTGKDLLTAFFPLLNFQTDCLQAWSFPLWNPYMNFGYPFVEHYSNTMFFPTHLLMGLLSGSTLVTIQREILLWMILGGFGMYLCVRQMGCSWEAGLLAGGSFMFSGQMTALPQWHLLAYNAACFPYWILGYLRAKSQAKAFSPLTMLFVAFSVLGGYLNTTVLGLYVFALYLAVDAIFCRNPGFVLRFLVINTTLAVLISLPKIAPVMMAMRLSPRMNAPASLYTKDPVNIVNIYNFMSYLLPVKYFFSLYIGLVSVLALTFAALRKRLRPDSLAVVFVLTAWLLAVDGEGNVSFLRSAANFLPLMKLVRNEWLEWFYPSAFLILFAARYVDDFLSVRDCRARAVTAAVVVGLMVACFLGWYGTEYYRSVLVVQLMLAAAWLAVPLADGRKRISAALIILLISAEFLIVFNRVNVDEPPLRQGDRVRVRVTDQGAVSRSYRDDNRVRSFFYAMAVRDHLRPSISMSRGHPVLTSGLGGADTINAYPEQYGNFIDLMNLKRFSGWWYNAQERFDFIEIKDSPLLAAMEGQPLFILFDLANRQPMDNTVSFDGISCSSFSFGVNSPNEGFFLLHQMFDPRWRVYVDGSEQPVKRANTYFMGLDVPAGRHAVEFRFRDKVFSASLFVSLATLAGLLAASVIRARRPRKEPLSVASS